VPACPNPWFRQHRLPEVLESFAELAAASALTNQCRGAGQLEADLRENDLSREGRLNGRLRQPALFGSVELNLGWPSRTGPHAADLANQHGRMIGGISSDQRHAEFLLGSSRPASWIIGSRANRLEHRSSSNISPEGARTYSSRR